MLLDGITPQSSTLRATSHSSQIAQSYQDYLQNCGPSFQEIKDEALDKYQETYPSANPTSPDFLAWAYDSWVPYRAAWGGCANSESIYKEMLATFTPDAPSATSIQTTATGASSATTGTSQGGGSSGPKKGGASFAVPPFSILVLTLVSGVKLLIG
ncbi:hypothetical protein C8R44DRAFT_875122 [Mycena epipterygia]|nr:hypothetical protein C8R44DRAFT_875122 [Mycena epipterygia]